MCKTAFKTHDFAALSLEYSLIRKKIKILKFLSFFTILKIVLKKLPLTMPALALSPSCTLRSTNR